MKKILMIIRQILTVTFQFIVLNSVVVLFISIIIFVTRDIELIRVTNIDESRYKLGEIFRYISLDFSLISFIIVNVYNFRKSYKISKGVFLSLVPVKIIFLFFLCLFFLGGWEGLCLWNPLIDTRHSNNFNVYNIDKIEIGMTEDEVTSFIGDPLEIEENKNKNKTEYIYTYDAAAIINDYAWLCLRVYFEDGKVYKCYYKWHYD